MNPPFRDACSRLLFFLALAGGASAQDVETFDCDSASGWETSADGPALRAAEGKIALSYERSKLAPLVQRPLLCELKELRLRLRSETEAVFAIVVEDRDGAKFHFPFRVAAGEWTDVKAAPKDFVPNEDSPVKKGSLDSARLGSGYVLFDSGAITKTAGRNVLEVDRVEVERKAIARREDLLVVDGEVEIKESLVAAAGIRVNPGGHLLVTAPRFVVGGDIAVTDGHLEFDGGIVVVPQRFNHERAFTAAGRSKIGFRKAFVATGVPAALHLRDSSWLVVDETECQGGFTCEVPEKGRATLRYATSPGEFVVAPGATVSVTGSKNVILWLSLGANLAGALTLPKGDVVEDWTSGAGLSLHVEKTRSVSWGVLSYPGGDGSVEDTELRAAGLIFGGRNSIEISGIENGSAPAEWTVPSADRKLAFRRTRVAAWNIYAADEAQVKVRKSVFGEAMSWGKSRIDVSDSTCDGAGGYIAASDSSEIRLARCRISCLVVAKDASTIVLDDCDVAGDVRATGKSTVRLVKCRTSGRVEADPGAKLVKD